VIHWEGNPRLLIRVSAQIYNQLQHYEDLGKVLKDLLD
jgi:isopenicillin-N epimerase